MPLATHAEDLQLGRFFRDRWMRCARDARRLIQEDFERAAHWRAEVKRCVRNAREAQGRWMEARGREGMTRLSERSGME